MNKLSRPIADLKNKNSGGFSYGGVNDAAKDMMNVLYVSQDRIQKLQEEYYDSLKVDDKQRQKNHKELLRVFVVATRKKMLAQKKIESSSKKTEQTKQKAKEKEVKKETKETEQAKKEEKIEAKKEADVKREQKPETKAEKAVEKATQPQAQAKPTPPTKPTAPTPTAKPVTQAAPKPSAAPVPPAVTAPTAVKVAGGGLLAAAAMSVRGETGGKSLDKVSTDAKKVGQVVPNDPKPGVSSYGIFGLNSGGSVQNFVKDNPQFGFSDLKPASKEFDDRWKNIAIERTQEFYQAQINWYKKYVYDPVKNDMQKLLPQHLGSDDGVVTYMADRRNQMGKLYESEAIKYAKDSKTPKEFISKIAEHDSSESYIRKAFPTYLKTHGDKNIPGLQNRVRIREEMSLKVSGDMMSSISSENANMRKDLQSTSSPTIIMQENNNTTVNKTNMVMKERKQELNPTMR